MKYAFMVALLSAIATGSLAAAGITIDDISADPHKFNERVVQVTGKVFTVEHDVFHNGDKSTRFLICEQSCIGVFYYGPSAVKELQIVTVRGTFFLYKHMDDHWFRNEIQADKGSL